MDLERQTSITAAIPAKPKAEEDSINAAIKKTAFCIPFIFSFIGFCISLKPFLDNPVNILSLDNGTLISIPVLTIFTVLSCFLFAVFVTLSQKWSYILISVPAVVITSIFFITQSSIIFAIACSASLMLVAFLLQPGLKTYITFKPGELLLPSVSQLITLILLCASIPFYISSMQNVKQKGFQLPDSLINSVLDAIPQDYLNQSGLPQSITPEQIIQIKNNPSVLNQLNIDPKILDDLVRFKKQITPKTIFKASIENQLKNYINPYLLFIPGILTFLFFVTFKSLSSLFSFLLYPLTWFTFWILEKTKYTHYEIETRQVRKLTV